MDETYIGFDKTDFPEIRSTAEFELRVFSCASSSFNSSIFTLTYVPFVS